MKICLYLVIFCIGVILLFFAIDFTIVRYKDVKIPWRLDAEYSMYLTIMATNYKTMTGSNSSDTVDAIRIYRIRQKHSDMYDLSKLFTKELVFETKDKQFIKRFILAAQDEIMHVENCFRSQDQETFHIAAFDNTFMRAGYFLFNVCNVKGDEYGIIQSLQKHHPVENSVQKHCR